MRRTTTVTRMKRHFVLRVYLAMARAEHIEPGRMTLEMAARTIETGERIYTEVHWETIRRVAEAVTRYRGLSADEQFEKGITALPGALANRMICEAMVRRFGIEAMTETPGFDGHGILRCESRHDILFPVRVDGWIDRFAFYSIGEMKGWAAKAA